MRKKVIVAAALLLLSGCGRSSPSLSVDPGPGAPLDLAASLTAKVRGDTVAFTLRVSNPTNGPVRIEFPSGQRYDFEVGTTVGERVWQWSADRAFTGALGTVALGAGESLEYSEEWRGARAGDYYVRARVTSTNKPVDLRSPFTVPSH